MSKLEYQRVPIRSKAVKQLHEHARRILPKGSHIVSPSEMTAIGQGDPEAGEAVLHRMFKMAAPGAVHPDAIRALGAGSVVKGRKVLQRFFDRADAQLGLSQFADGGAVDDDEQLANPVGGNFGTMTPQEAAATAPTPLDRIGQGMTGLAREVLTAPGNALNSPTPVTTADMIKPAADLASMVTLGAGAAPAEANALRAGIKAYHGSPYDFERFDLSKIGTGEGAQAYGHGLYMAENPAVAEEYKAQLGKPSFTLDGQRTADNEQSAITSVLHTLPTSQIDHIREGGLELTPDILNRAKALHLNRLGVPPDATEYLKDFDTLEGKTLKFSRQGKMYEVNINANPEHFLDWNKPLSEQSEHVQKALDKIGVYEPEPPHPAVDPEGAMAEGPLLGAGVWDQVLHEHVTKPKGRAVDAALEMLRDAGVPGIRYLDQGSRWFKDFANDKLRAAAAAKEYKPTWNYVIFDPSTINIIKKYGIAGLIAGGLAHFKTPADQESELQAEHEAQGGRTKYFYERVPRAIPQPDGNHGRAL